ncbi:hypothetical protein, partial [Streptococcus suis]
GYGKMMIAHSFSSCSVSVVTYSLHERNTMSVLGCTIFYNLSYENYKRTLDKLKKNFEEYYSINELNQIFGVKDLNEIKVDILKISIPVSLIWIVISIIGIIKFW